MQAQDIKVGETYAILNEDQEPIRFRVEQIDTTKHRSGHKTTYTSEAYGSIYSTDFNGELPADPEQARKLLSRWVPVDKILGDYKEHTELLAKAKAEGLAAKEQREGEERNAKQLLDLFFDLIDAKRPDPNEEAKKKYYERFGHFEMRYGKIEIDTKGVEKLLKALTSKLEPADK